MIKTFIKPLLVQVFSLLLNLPKYSFGHSVSSKIQQSLGKCHLNPRELIGWKKSSLEVHNVIQRAAKHRRLKKRFLHNKNKANKFNEAISPDHRVINNKKSFKKFCYHQINLNQNWNHSETSKHLKHSFLSNDGMDQLLKLISTKKSNNKFHVCKTGTSPYNITTRFHLNIILRNGVAAVRWLWSWNEKAQR